MIRSPTLIHADAALPWMSLEDWLLFRPQVLWSCLVLSGIAILVGLTSQASNATWLFLVPSFVWIVAIVFRMRATPLIETGPRVLDIPRIRSCLIISAALFAPAFICANSAALAEFSRHYMALSKSEAPTQKVVGLIEQQRKTVQSVLEELDRLTGEFAVTNNLVTKSQATVVRDGIAELRLKYDAVDNQIREIADGFELTNLGFEPLKEELDQIKETLGELAATHSQPRPVLSSSVKDIDDEVRIMTVDRLVDFAEGHLEGSPSYFEYCSSDSGPCLDIAQLAGLEYRASLLTSGLWGKINHWSLTNMNDNISVYSWPIAGPELAVFNERGLESFVVQGSLGVGLSGAILFGSLALLIAFLFRAARMATTGGFVTMTLVAPVVLFTLLAFDNLIRQLCVKYGGEALLTFEDFHWDNFVGSIEDVLGTFANDLLVPVLLMAGLLTSVPIAVRLLGIENDATPIRRSLIPLLPVAVAFASAVLLLSYPLPGLLVALLLLLAAGMTMARLDSDIVTRNARPAAR